MEIWLIKNHLKRTRIVHIHSTKTYNVLLNVIKDIVMILHQMFGASLYGQNWSTAIRSRPYVLVWKSDTETRWCQTSTQPRKAYYKTPPQLNGSLAPFFKTPTPRTSQIDHWLAQSHSDQGYPRRFPYPLLFAWYFVELDFRPMIFCEKSLVTIHIRSDARFPILLIIIVDDIRRCTIIWPGC